jgi:hypothetical protein
MRRLHRPTLAQWGCDHRWKTTTSRPGGGEILRVRYLVCRRCGLRVKSEERLAVPWDETDLVAQVKALLPEDQAVALWDRGITELPLAGLNARLARQGYVIQATKGRNAKRLVACMGEDEQVKLFGLFELRQTSRKAVGGTNIQRAKGAKRSRDKARC